MYTHLINTMKNLPISYETTGIAFWDDEHISKFMLQNHLAPESDGASRRHGFIEKSVEWIVSIAVSDSKLLDLGCGPGIYAEKLYDKGYHVTGIDFSKRSIEYARQSAGRTGRSIEYINQDYLTIEYKQAFDLAMIIYCDFGVLSPVNRKTLLAKVYAALKPGGVFILDAFTPRQYDNFKDDMVVSFEKTGFWRPVPHLCIQRNKRYDNDIFLEQHTVLTENGHQTYNIWNHAFTTEELDNDLRGAGFDDVSFYGDATGSAYEQDSLTICAVCRKA